MWSALKAGVRRLARRSATDRELDDEIRHFIELQAEEYVRAGMSIADARRRAVVNFGSVTTVKQRVRESGWEARVHSLWQDVRYGARTMRRNPAFAVVAVLTIALGVGVNSAMFSLVDSALLRTLPVHRSEQLVMLSMGEGDNEFTNPIWESIRDRQDVFSGAFALSTTSFDLSNGGETRRAVGSYVSGDFFSTLGTSPLAGRLLTRGDDWRGCPAVAVVSSGFWERELRGIEGSTLRPTTISLNGRVFDVIGVTRPDFPGVIVGTSVDIYVPLCAEAAIRGSQDGLDARTTWWLTVMARLKPGMTIDRARARLAAIAPSVFAEATPQDFPAESQRRFRERRLFVSPAATGVSPMREQYRKPLLVLMGAAAVVLLIACANVANLMLARASAREQEIAIRVAMGAGRARLVRQLLTESVLLSLLGAAVGVVLALASSGAMISLISSGGQPVHLDLAPNLRLLAYATVIALVTGVSFGLAPAWRAFRVDPSAAMKSGGRGVIGRHRNAGIRSWFVVIQLALSLVLVMAAALLLGTFRSLSTLDPGFRQEGVLLVTVDPRKARFDTTRQHVVRQELLARLRAVPGVRAASASLITPVSGRGANGPIGVDGFVPKAPRDAMTFFNEVADEYFTTMQMPLVAGREIGPQDTRNAPRVAVINETMARKFFGDAPAIGRRFRKLSPVGEEQDPPEYEVVGVVRDSKYSSLREKERAIAFLPLSQSPASGTIHFELRSDLPPNVLAPQVTRVMKGVNASLSIDYATLSGQIASSIRRERVLATLATAFGALALLLASIGVYGTIAYGVARRRNEIGVRLALGADRRRVMRMVLGQSGRLVTIGIVLGMLGAFGAMRVIASLLYGVTAADGRVIAGSVLTLVIAALAAAALPAWRAARIDPVATLREQ